jgi:hypothetical protein
MPGIVPRGLFPAAGQPLHAACGRPMLPA